MKKPTQEQITEVLNNQARDNIAPRDPEAAHQLMLRLGCSQEADQAARFAELQNEANGFLTAKAS